MLKQNLDFKHKPMKAIIFIICIAIMPCIFAKDSQEVSKCDSAAVSKVANPDWTQNAQIDFGVNVLVLGDTVVSHSEKTPKEVRKEKKQQRKACRKENPKPLGEILVTQILPPILTALLAILANAK